MKEQLITKKILNWYDLNKRSLPWRKNVSLQKRQYYTLVSEFMLQQTQVVSVIPYFNKSFEIRYYSYNLCLLKHKFTDQRVILSFLKRNIFSPR